MAAYSRSPRDGKHIEVLCYFNHLPGQDGGKRMGLKFDHIKKIDKKVREAQLAQYNYILVVGESEASTGQVGVFRIRDSAVHSVKSIEDLLEEFKTKTAEYQ
ncbi:hypothetical protein HID58_095265 [Brassica napus]|uniref:Anticodon-binding domain-containing protein n=1 Tax=Brassica napus TaxID=3708 RepID=A0ABQ7X482_BRANA|nr:hypothetical protein HID58_095265 [Brassica napus]